jgi:hypothetical protein
MNDDTYEEVVTFKLSRLSVYVMLSTILVVLVGLTVALIDFTPLKYYIPGSTTDFKTAKELRDMKIRQDEMSKQLDDQVQYIESLKKVLRGDVLVPLDTTVIDVPQEETRDN